jgi:hypothetical protein
MRSLKRPDTTKEAKAKANSYIWYKVVSSKELLHSTEFDKGCTYYPVLPAHTDVREGRNKLELLLGY